MDSRSRLHGVVCAIAPHLAPPRRDLLIEYATWTITLDDRLDMAGADPSGLDRLGDAIDRITSSPGDVVSQVGDPMLRRLAVILDALREFEPYGGDTARAVGAALGSAVRSGIEHARLGHDVFAGAMPPPSINDYLRVAAGSVNYHSFALALLGLSGVATPGMRAVVPALDHAARAVRLANDLRSLARDQAERTLNVLSLPGVAGMSVTTTLVRRLIDMHARSHHTMLDRIGPPAAPILHRSLKVSLDLYHRTDLR